MASKARQSRSKTASVGLCHFPESPEALEWHTSSISADDMPGTRNMVRQACSHDRPWFLDKRPDLVEAFDARRIGPNSSTEWFLAAQFGHGRTGSTVKMLCFFEVDRSFSIPAGDKERLRMTYHTSARTLHLYADEPDLKKTAAAMAAGMAADFMQADLHGFSEALPGIPLGVAVTWDRGDDQADTAPFSERFLDYVVSNMNSADLEVTLEGSLQEPPKPRP